MIYEYFRATGAHDLFTIGLQSNDVHDFDVGWDQDLLSASDMPADVILEGLYKSKLQDSVQLQTVLALYDQEAVRNHGQTSYLRLNTSVKLHIDQMLRTRNFRVWNEVVEKGSVTKSQKGKNACEERKERECFQWEAHGQFPKGDSCNFSNDTKASGNSGGGQRPKARSSSPPHQIRWQSRLAVKQAREMKALTREVRFCIDIKNVKTLRVSWPSTRVSKLQV